MCDVNLFNLKFIFNLEFPVFVIAFNLDRTDSMKDNLRAKRQDIFDNPRLPRAKETRYLGQLMRKRL